MRHLSNKIMLSIMYFLCEFFILITGVHLLPILEEGGVKTIPLLIYALGIMSWAIMLNLMVHDLWFKEKIFSNDLEI